MTNAAAIIKSLPHVMIQGTAVNIEGTTQGTIAINTMTEDTPADIPPDMTGTDTVTRMDATGDTVIMGMMGTGIHRRDRTRPT